MLYMGGFGEQLVVQVALNNFKSVSQKCSKHLNLKNMCAGEAFEHVVHLENVCK